MLVLFARRASLVTYPVAITLIYAILATIPAWILLDACFDSALMWARIDLGIPDEIGTMFASFPEAAKKYHEWNAFGLRIVSVLAIVATLAVLFAVAFARVVLERSSRRDVFAISFAFLGFTTLAWQYENLLWAGARHRVSGQLSRFQAAAVPLIDHWPTQSGELPEAGKYSALQVLPGELRIQDCDSYSPAESFGCSIERLPGGGIIFSLEPHYRYSVEYHPPDLRPLPQRHTRYTVETLTRTAMLSDGWYLTEYSSIRK